MIRKLLDDGRFLFGAMLFFTLIGNPIRVIIGEASKANAIEPPQQVEQTNYEEQRVTKEQEEAVQKICSPAFEDIRARIVYKAMTSDVETPEEVKNYQHAIVILKVCPRNNVSY